MKSAAGPFLALLALAFVAVGMIEFAGFKDIWAAFAATIGATIFMGLALIVMEFGPMLEKAPKCNKCGRKVSGPCVGVLCDECSEKALNGGGEKKWVASLAEELRKQGVKPGDFAKTISKLTGMSGGEER